MNRRDDYLRETPGDATPRPDSSFAAALRRATDAGSGVSLSAAVRGRLRRRKARRAAAVSAFGLACCAVVGLAWGGAFRTDRSVDVDERYASASERASSDPAPAVRELIQEGESPKSAPLLPPSAVAVDEGPRPSAAEVAPIPLPYSQVVSELRQLTESLGISTLTVRSTEKNGLEFAAHYTDEESLSGARNGELLAALARIIGGYDHVVVEMNAGELVRLSMLVLPPRHSTLEVIPPSPNYPASRR